MNWHRYNNEPTWSLYPVVPPDEVVSLDEMKAHLRVDDDDNDEIIEAITQAATENLDGPLGLLGRALSDQTWDLKLSWFPGCGYIQIPLPPLIEVLSVKYIDEDDAEQTFATSDYYVIGQANRGRIFLRSGKTWPVLGSGWAESVTVRFRAGYIDSSVSPAIPAIPAPIIAAIKLTAATLYENRETIVIGQSAIELPGVADMLVRPYWIPGS